MTEKAYLGLNEDDCWALYYGDGSEDQKYILAVGRPFETGSAIRDAVDELQQWAWENGYELDAPLYSTMDVSLTDVIEPELFDEVFGTDDQESDY